MSGYVRLHKKNEATRKGRYLRRLLLGGGGSIVSTIQNPCAFPENSHDEMLLRCDLCSGLDGGFK